ncbi:MAG TPA: MCE family protein [Nocardioidaceae bacterium]|nr:MCE family protein [Nocardioidaceae bacterium]
MLLVNIHREEPREHVKLFLAGVVFVSVIAGLIAVSIGIYNKTLFDTVTTVTLQADRAGLQLPKYGDVRYNGVLVGQVRSISQTGDKAIIELGLEPSDAQLIPENVEANILPTTLFGQKFVSLVDPTSPGPLGIQDGTVIPSERVHTSTELSDVLNRLFPLLRAVRPVDLSATLSALATALNGRGEAVGQTLDRLDGYLTAINQHLPTLQEDLRLLGTVADAYNVAAPDLVAALGNLTITSRTIAAKKQGVAGLLGDLRNVAVDGAELLEQNEANLIREGDLAVPLVRLLEKYAPEYNCLLRGIAAYKPVLLKTFAGGEVKQYVEFPSPQVRAYDERDIPEYNDTRGPRCIGLPNNPPIPWPGYDTDNGTNLDNPRGRGTSYFPGGSGVGRLFSGVLGSATSDSGADVSSTPDGRRATAAELSTRSGLPAGDLTTLGTLMYGPMAGGAQ